MCKWAKRIVLGGLVIVGAGVLFFHSGVASYVRSSGRMIKSAVEDAIPVEFEIQRARDMLEDLIPEMRANLRLVAAEEVDVAHLEAEIAREADAIEKEAKKLQSLRGELRTDMASYRISGRTYTRSEVVEELSRRFEHLQTAELLLDGKKELLRNRQRSLDAAVEKLENTRRARLELASQIEALEAQFRLIQAQSTESEFHLDETKLAQTQKVIGQLKKRLEVAQKELAWEARFVENIPVEEPVNETSVVERVDEYFSDRPTVWTEDSAAELVHAAE